MKIKEEQKEVLKSVSKKMTDLVVEDIKDMQVSSMKRPLALVVLTIAAIGVSRDPLILMVGAAVALVVLAIRSTSAEDVAKLKASLKREEKTQEEKKDSK